MKFKVFAGKFLTIFPIAFIAAILATLFTNYFVRRNGLIIDWETCFILAFILALVVPFTQNKKSDHVPVMVELL